MSQVATQLNQQKVGKADANGLVSITFDGPPAAMVNRGSIVVPGSPGGALYQAAVGTPGAALPTLGWAGNSTGGPIQASTPVVVTGVGLVPGVSYLFNFLGQCVSADDIGSSPAPVNFSTTSTQSLGQLILSGSGNVNEIIPIAPTYRALRLHTGPSGVSLVIVQGQTTGTFYAVNLGTLPPDRYFDIPVDGAVDSSVQLTLNSNGNWWITAQLADVTVNVTTASDQPLAVSVSNTENASGELLPLDVVPYGGRIHLTSGPIANGATWAALPAAGVNQAYRLHRYAQFGPLGVPPGGPSAIQTAVTNVSIGGIPTGEYVDRLDGLVTAEVVNVVNLTGAAAVFTLVYDNIILPLIG